MALKTVMPNAFPAFKNQSPKTNNVKFYKSGKKDNLFVLILDESGSMSPVRDDTIKGVNGLLADQKNDPIKSHIKIVKFASMNVSTVRDHHISKITPLTTQDYSPMGGTNLLDAIGKTILEINEFLKSKRSDRRPSVIVQITTDGEENSSSNFTLDQVKSLITEAQEAGWIFTFIGAGVDSYKASTAIGINQNATSNYNVNNTAQTYSSMNASLGRMKRFVAAGQTNADMYASAAIYTSEERKNMGDK